MKNKILIIEDEPHIREGLKANFEISNYDVELVDNGKDAIDSWSKKKCDLILLDIMLPKVDGFTILSHIRKSDADVPVIILSAKDQVEDRIHGLSLKADDYIVKPFNFKELLLKCERLLEKRNTHLLEVSKIKIGPWTIDPKELTAKCLGKEPINLSPREVKLIEYLHTFKNSFVTRADLLKNVWEINPKTKTRTVDIFISRMRKHFEDDPSSPNFFISKRLKGYKLLVE